MSASLLVSCVGVATCPGLCPIAKGTTSAAPTLCTEYGWIIPNPSRWMDYWFSAMKKNKWMKEYQEYMLHIPWGNGSRVVFDAEDEERVEAEEEVEERVEEEKERGRKEKRRKRERKKREMKSEERERERERER